jgi:chromosome segregation ATPase
MAKKSKKNAGSKPKSQHPSNDKYDHPKHDVVDEIDNDHNDHNDNHPHDTELATQHANGEDIILPQQTNGASSSEEKFDQANQTTTPSLVEPQLEKPQLEKPQLENPQLEETANPVVPSENCPDRNVEEMQQVIDRLKSSQSQLNDELEKAVIEKEQSEQQYQNLVEKISHIKATLGARLKSDSAEIESLKQQVDALQRERLSLSSSIETLQKEVISASKESDHLSHELSQVRGQFQDKMKQWARERDTLLDDKKKALDKYEQSSVLVRDLDVAIGEERALKDNTNIRIASLEDQVSTQTNYAERFRTESSELRALLKKTQQELNTRSAEFKQKVSASDSEAQVLTDQLTRAVQELSSTKDKLADLELGQQRMPHLEEEVKEKNLLIGKLRHEAVILNEHLTKALRMIKKESEGDTVDKLLITNLILAFVSIPRGDSKKFEVLQLISNTLGWDDDQKAQAGLMSRQGSITSPKRSQSYNSLALADDASSAGKFMNLFAEFLERESSKRT